MSQSKKKSLIESIVNTLVGFLITMAVSPFIYWVCDVKMSLPQMSVVTLLFTLVSIIRNYVIRRYFNKQESTTKKRKIMTNKTKIILSIAGFFAFLLLFSGCWAVNKNIDTDNSEVELRTAITAKKEDQEATFDKMWKVLQQKAQIADQYKTAFQDIYPKLIEGRYSQGDGSLMKWITESNPTFDVSLYKDLMNSIEIERNGFLTTQRQLMDLKREHDNLRLKFPSRWFINNDVKEILIKIVSSTHAKEVIESGKDDDIDLFKEKK